MRKRLQESLLLVIRHANNVDERATQAGDMISSSQRMTGDINSAVTDLANGATSMAQDALALLKEQQQFVRCKDCKYWTRRELGSYGTCEHFEGCFDVDWFCADGER